MRSFDIENQISGILYGLKNEQDGYMLLVEGKNGNIFAAVEENHRRHLNRTQLKKQNLGMR